MAVYECAGMCVMMLFYGVWYVLIYFIDSSSPRDVKNTYLVGETKSIEKI